ncbi:hypothetical protein DYU11_20185 [Fibrisoma montanum]|uniref:Uncharacterized protein n=1 Tax=Fibrisoma montanum TaxID=2305895 RepID=A0A418M3M2_9BACT|nr:hypothetical protein [Fibrisoma montanum]RIV20372.1 hypothetical protein DYU11_20185 [Fibrisoma montanum]
MNPIVTHLLVFLSALLLAVMNYVKGNQKAKRGEDARWQWFFMGLEAGLCVMYYCKLSDLLTTP